MTKHAWTWNRNGFWVVATAAAALVALTALGCHGDGHHVLSDNSDLALTDARVSVDGRTVDGATLPRGHGEGGTARFEAVLMGESGPPIGSTVWVEHHRPESMGMMDAGVMFRLYDDGTHGDPVAGDGVYCYDDLGGEYGCHTSEAQPGEHRYEFYGMDHAGRESNHMTITVTITE